MRPAIDVVGLVLNGAAMPRLIGAILFEQSVNQITPSARYITLETINILSHNSS